MFYKKAAIIVLNWNGLKYLPDCLGTLVKQDYPKESREFILVDNASEDESVKYCQEHFHEITIIQNEKNFGFDKGNNIGIKYALEKGYDYIVLLNQDTAVKEDWLAELVKAAETDQKIGAVQSLMLYYVKQRGNEHETTRIKEYKVNSWGNQLHFLGFGFCGGNGEKLPADYEFKVHEIVYASGASILLRADILREIGGGFDEAYYLYHEDTDLSFRIRMAGYKVVIAPKSVMYHNYEFSRSIKKYYYMERNRYRILLQYLKWPTLILNFPAFIAMEAGMWIFALKGGWSNEKWRAYKYIACKTNLKDIFYKRRLIQRGRKISEKEFIKDFAGEIMYQEINNPLLRYIANPAFNIYWGAVKAVMWW